MLLKWSEELDVNNSSINEEHKILIDLMNILYAKNQAHAPKEELISILSEIENKAREHFKHEEQYMKDHNYPGLLEHREVHLKLLKRLGFFIEEYSSSIKKQLHESIFLFLKMWLSSHIKGIDKKYSEFIKL